MTEEFSITLRATIGCRHIEQMGSHGVTLISIPEDYPPTIKVHAVRIDGIPRWFRRYVNNEVVIHQIPLEGQTIDLVCLRASEPLKLPQDSLATCIFHGIEYGLQRAESRCRGVSA